MIKIKKKFQGTVPDNKILNVDSTSQTDTYSCEKINNMLESIENTAIDTVPIDAMFEYDGEIVPEGYEEVSGKLPFNYSTEEQIVGTWVDDKPIYQKTVHWSGTSDVSMSIPHNIEDLDKVIDFDVIGRYDDNFIKIPFLYGSGTNSVGAFVTPEYFQFRNETTHTYAYIYFTIRYTKTTD